MVAVEIHKGLVTQKFRPRLADVTRAAAQALVGGEREYLLAADVTLLEVGDVAIHDQLNLLIHPVLQHLLHVTEVVFRNLRDRLPEVTTLPVPIHQEVIRLVLLPTVEIGVVLYAVLPELHLRRLPERVPAQHG